MGKKYRVYKNKTNMVQTFIDANGKAVTAGIGKTVRILTITDTKIDEANEARKKALTRK